MTATIRRRPDFIGVGVQRSGTTYLQSCLEQHPEIGKPPRGLHFFSRNRDYNPEIADVDELDLAWYETQLGRFADRKVVGEFSVTYGFSENLERTAAQIREHYPEVRILIALRNPVERALSEYGKLRQGAEIPKGTTIAEFVETQAAIVERGRYHRLLSTYRSLFPAEQIHVKIFEDMLADRDAWVSSLYAFLGVDPDFRPPQLTSNPNPSRPVRFDAVEGLILRIQDLLRPLKEGRLGFLHRALRDTGVRELMRRVNVEAGQRQAPDADRALLAELYREDIRRVESLLGRELPAWR